MFCVNLGTAQVSSDFGRLAQNVFGRLGKIVLGVHPFLDPRLGAQNFAEKVSEQVIAEDAAETEWVASWSTAAGSPRASRGAHTKTYPLFRTFVADVHDRLDAVDYLHYPPARLIFLADVAKSHI